MLKKVVMYIKPLVIQCEDVKKYLIEQDVNLQVRDIQADPLGRPEISRLLRHFDLKHFLDSDSKTFKKNKIEKSMPERDEVISMIADDNDLLRVPIIVAGRLMTIGCNREKISEMLQIRRNGSNSDKEERPRPSRINRRTRK